MDGEVIAAIETAQRGVQPADKTLAPRVGRTDPFRTEASTIAGDKQKRDQPDMVVDVYTGSDRARSSRTYARYYAKYNIDEETRQVSVQIIDMDEERVVLEIPPEQVIEIARELNRYLERAKEKAMQPGPNGV